MEQATKRQAMMCITHVLQSAKLARKLGVKGLRHTAATEIVVHLSVLATYFMTAYTILGSRGRIVAYANYIPDRSLLIVILHSCILADFFTVLSSFAKPE